MNSSQTINDNNFRYLYLVSEYSKMISEKNFKLIKNYNPNWKPDISNKINRVIYITDYDGNTIKSIYELNFIINLCVLKRLYYKNYDLNISHFDLGLINNYIITSLKYNFENYEIVNLANFKLFFYTKNLDKKIINTYLYKLDQTKDINNKELYQNLDCYLKKFIFGELFQEIDIKNYKENSFNLNSFNENSFNLNSFNLNSFNENKKNENIRQYLFIII